MRGIATFALVSKDLKAVSRTFRYLREATMCKQNQYSHMFYFNYKMSGMLRVIMKPLISQIPLFGGIQIFFLNSPSVDFNLIGVVDVLDMPGLKYIDLFIVTASMRIFFFQSIFPKILY